MMMMKGSLASIRCFASIATSAFSKHAAAASKNVSSSTWASRTTATTAKAASETYGSSSFTTISKGFPMLFRYSQNEHAPVGQWLLITSGMVVGMIQVGAWTRLTQSGLSMTTWSPLGGLPPRTLQEWQDEFHRYQQFPEWEQRRQMTLREFQYIYAWEYGHRMLGRVLGVVFLLPWMYFTLRGRIPTSFQPRMIGLALLGGTQGLIGWWMVQSGLGNDRRNDPNQIRVKPLRLATHLTMAFATYGTLLWTAWDLLQLPYNTSSSTAATKTTTTITKTTTTTSAIAKSPWMEYVSQLPRDTLKLAKRLHKGSMVVTGLTAITVVSGALVAGSDAGRAYNTFPKMNGDWIPPSVWETLFSSSTSSLSSRLTQWWKQCHEDTATIQWNHRVLASVTTASAVTLIGYGIGHFYSPTTAAGAAVLSKALLLPPQVRFGFVALEVAIIGQVALGITTLLYYVPISLAAMHQLGSVAVFTSSLYLTYMLRRVVAASPAIHQPAVIPRTLAAATTTTTTSRAARLAKKKVTRTS